MKFIFLVLCFVYCESAPMTKEQTDESIEYLKRYGYLPEEYKSNQDELFEAIVDFQNFAGMNMTGQMDNSIYEMMQVPRCGIADMFRHKEEIREKRYATYRVRWPRRTLSYQIRRYSEVLSPGAVDRDVAAAFGIWSKYTNLVFQKRAQGSRADFTVVFGKRNHGDSSPFDGSGNVLAHAYFPRAGEIHFDDDERWVEGSQRGINFYHVAVHEIGHSLGLYHSSVRGAIMQPFYGGYKAELYSRLPRDDIRGIQSLYGQSNRLEERMKGVVKTDAQAVCTLEKFDSVFILGETIYVLSGGKSYQIDLARQKIDVAEISASWEGVPNTAKAFAYNEKIYFYQDSKYWRFNGGKMDGEYPKGMDTAFVGIPSDPNAVVVMQDKVVFFKDSSYWVFDPLKFPRVKPTYPKTIHSYFEGFPSKLDAVIEINKNVVGFKDNKFYVFDGLKQRVVAAPLEINKFFGCNDA